MQDMQTKPAQMPSGWAFELPAPLQNTPFKSLGMAIHHFFRFQLVPLKPTVPYEELTAGQLAHWIYSTIGELRTLRQLPFEPGHLAAVIVALRDLGADFPDDPSTNVRIDKLFPRAEFKTRWARLGATLDTPLPRPTASCLATLLAVGLATAVFILVFQALDTFAQPVLRVGGRLIGWLCFLGAMGLAKIIASWLANYLPNVPPQCSGTSALAAFIAANHVIDPDSPNAWTLEQVWEKTRALIAATFKTMPDEIHPDVPLSRLPNALALIG